MKNTSSQVEADRQLLADAQAKGTKATLGAYFKLSGPGWLQSAITLGGGSLAGALFLGIISGTALLWLQLVAIVMGVVMLSAISYVALSTGERPFQSIRRHINPVLAWGWIAATCMANIIWCMPQFSLCYEALEKNLLPDVVGDSGGWKLGVSLTILVVVSFVVAMSARPGKAAKLFDWFLRGLVGMIVVSFVGVVALLSFQGDLNWSTIFSGFVPDLNQWTAPTGEVAILVDQLPESWQKFWTGKIVPQQRAVMIGVVATAVGINMTFLLPYSMLQRGWDKTFRGLARFDLSTSMAIPYVLVVTCVVIAASHAFHGKADEKLLSTDPEVMQQSDSFKGTRPFLEARLIHEMGNEDFEKLSEDAQLTAMARVPESEKRIAASLVKRNAFEFSKSLAPLVGDKVANYVFGIGVFGMGFSTIIILMLINGFVFREASGMIDSKGMYVAGCLVAGLAGAAWPLIWDGPAKMWLAILTSSFGLMLLPIAYVTFFMMMNNPALMGKNMPTGWRRASWNVLMGISVLGSIVAAGISVYDKATDTKNPVIGRVVLGVVTVYGVMVVLGFLLKKRETPSSSTA